MNWVWTRLAAVANETLGGDKFVFLYRCPVCSATVDDFGRDGHEEWHVARGESPDGVPATV